MSEPENRSYGAIVGFLLQEGVIDEAQIRLASRIRSKLANPGPLLGVLKETGSIDDGQIQAVLTRHRLKVPIGDMLVELGHLEAGELQMASTSSEPSRTKTGRRRSSDTSWSSITSSRTASSPRSWAASSDSSSWSPICRSSTRP